MLSPVDIVCLYDSVLTREESFYAISPARFKNAIRNMAEAYKPDNTDWDRQASGNVANYNDSAHRCAYLHKYAPLHTCLVQDMFYEALAQSSVLRNRLYSKNGKFKICSLGGGPGTDIIGILSACQPFRLLPGSAQIVDLMSGWKSTFKSIVEELRYGNVPVNFNWSYIAENLLQGMGSEVCESIRSADLITMVKFVSAATCRDTKDMIKMIFSSIKVGAFVLFIDNAAGGFSHVVSRSAKECGLITIFGPLNHYQYTKPEFNITRYGYVSCFETKVTVQIFMNSSQWKNQAYLQSIHQTLQEPIPRVHQRKNDNQFAFVIFILFIIFIIIISYYKQGRRGG